MREVANKYEEILKILYISILIILLICHRVLIISVEVILELKSLIENFIFKIVIALVAIESTELLLLL